MIQLQVLSGKQAGSDIVVRHFPFLIGRGADVDLRLDEAGVWDRHVQIDFRRKDGFSVSALGEALISINSDSLPTASLRNGDVVGIGSVQLRFWLARSEQKTLRVREALTWTALFALFFAQFGLIYWLLK